MDKGSGQRTSPSTNAQHHPTIVSTAGESPEELWEERSNLDGVLLSGIAYGILFTLAIQTIHQLLRLPRTEAPKWMIAQVIAFLALGTCGFGINARITQRTFIDDRGFPGGPNAASVALFRSPLSVGGFVCFTVMSWLADAVVLWRFTIFWGRNYVAAGFPLLMFLGAIACSLTFIIALFVPSATADPTSFLAIYGGNFGLAFWSLSVSLNVVLTVSIAAKILWVRRHLVDVLGRQHARQYTSIAALLVESAALYAFWSTAFIVSYARASPMKDVLLPSLGQIQGIAPILIIRRMAQGRAWSRNTMNLRGSNLTGIISSSEVIMRDLDIPPDEAPLGLDGVAMKRIVETR
ncbi:hypothetical protein MKEN_00177800 [Mycena kentingensis (nom. inval.)]|nr:hypothetical protein MKEN_00177800 [Mycena kentingensis (nom. inval.)]